MTPAQMLPLVYDELRKLAAAKLMQEKPGQTLDATVLVHEAFIKLGGERSFNSKSDYLKAAAQAMRRILVDRSRARQAVKRDGGKQLDVDPNDLANSSHVGDFQALDEALSKLALSQPQQAELVQLKFFGGLTLDQCAETLSISSRTADTWWAYARAWLAIELSRTDDNV